MLIAPGGAKRNPGGGMQGVHRPRTNGESRDDINPDGTRESLKMRG